MTSIRTNLPALNALQHTRRSSHALQTAIERLGSGLRVNSAKDDAAGMAIGNRMTSQITGQAMAKRNANDGISLSATTESALSSLNDKLQRVRELSVQGLNGSLNQTDRDTIQAEINLNLKEIDRVVKQTEFNGVRLLDGTGGIVNLQVGANDGQTLGVDLRPPGFDVEALGLKDFNISGILGDVIDINTLAGHAVNVILGSADTTVSYTDNLGNTLPASTKLMQQGSAGSYFVQSTDAAGQPIHYLAHHTSHSTTATRSSEVQVTADTGIYFRERDNIQGNHVAIGTTQYLDETGNALPAGANPTLVRDDTHGHHYLRVQEGGETFYYRATVTSQSSRATPSSSDITSIQIETGSPRFTTLDYDPAPAQLPGANMATPPLPVWLNSDASPFTDGPQRELVEAAGSYYVRAGTVGDTRYYAASVATDLTTGAITVSAESDALTTRSFTAEPPHPNPNANPIAYTYLTQGGFAVNGALVRSDGDGALFMRDLDTNTYYAATLNYVDAGGNTVDPDTYIGAITAVIQATTALGIKTASFTPGDVTLQASSPAVPSNATGLPAGTTLLLGQDNRYYLQSTNAGDTFYEPVSVTTSVAIDGSASIGTTSLGPARMRADFNSATTVGALDTATLLGADALSFDLPGAELVEDQAGRYYLRQLNAASAEFYTAEVTTVMQSDGSYTLSIGNTGLAREFDDVLVVTGTSTVALDTPLPPNVKVRYLDNTGKVHQNVLSKDAKGNYVLSLPDHGNGTTKTATLVRVENLENHLISQDGDILVKTLNGAGDIVIYHAMSYEAITNAGADETVVDLKEAGDDIRIREPRDPLAALDRAIARIDDKRSTLGATQNRLESVISTLTTSNTQLSAARSRILDADYAVEVSNMTRAQILQQAGMSVLAHANQVPQTVLSMLQ